MDFEKEQFIKEQIDIDYVRKSKNSSLAFILVAILFLFLDKLEDNFKVQIICLSLSVIAFNLLRFLNWKQYFAGHKSIKDAVLINSMTVIVNSSIWCALGIISTLSYGDNNFQILVIFIILIAFSAGAIVTVSHKLIIFNTLNYLILLPQALYSILQFTHSGDPGKLWLLGYTVINLFYNLSQGKVIQDELHSRFSTEYELKKSLEEIALSKKNLEEESIKTFHASRLSSLGEMAGGVAHEINNPLTIIQGMVKSILVHNDETALDEQVKSKLTKINAASERIAKIVKGMKIISSKNDQIEHEIVKVSKVLEISIDLYEEKFKNETIRFKLENTNDPDIKCNPLQISQILINLVSNAIDALQKLDEDKYLTIKITKDPVTHSVDIRVINSGPVLENAVSAKIFEPFFSTKSLGKGTGLGLSISSTLAHSNHGNLSYEVYEGQVCFKLHIESHT